MDSRRVCQLKTAELFVLYSMRLAARMVRESNACEDDYERGFLAAKLTPGHGDHLMMAMRMIGLTALAPVHVHRVKCHDISSDENQLLNVVAALQHNDEFTAQRLLRALMPPTAARRALMHFETLASGLAAAGLALPPRNPIAPDACPMVALALRRLSEQRRPSALASQDSDMVWLS